MKRVPGAGRYRCQSKRYFLGPDKYGYPLPNIKFTYCFYPFSANIYGDQFSITRYDNPINNVIHAYKFGYFPVCGHVEHLLRIAHLKNLSIRHNSHPVSQALPL